MPNLPMEITVGRLPLNPIMSAKELFISMVNRMKGVVSGSDVIVGSTDTADPSYDVGPWFRPPGVALLLWNTERWNYTYAKVAIDNNGFELRADAVPHSNQTQAFQDDDGTIALTYDLYVPRDVVLLDGTSGSIALNPSTSENYYLQLHANTNIAFITDTLPEGKTLTFGVINNGTAYTFNLPGGVLWDSGMEPVQPVSGAGGSGYAEYKVTMIHTVMYGEFTDYGTQGLPTGTITYPAIPRNYAGAQAPPAVSRIKNLP